MAQDFTLGRHEALIEKLVDDTSQMRADIGVIRDYITEQKAERKVVLWLAGGAGAFTSAVMSPLALKVIGWLHVIPK